MRDRSFGPEAAALAATEALRPLGTPERAAGSKEWVRRSALLALLPGIRSGKPELTRFTRYAESMLAEKEFFIRKAIGWVLREIAQHDSEFTAEWTENHIFEMSGVTFREAIRRLPVSEAERLTSLRGR